MDISRLLVGIIDIILIVHLENTCSNNRFMCNKPHSHTQPILAVLSIS